MAGFHRADLAPLRKMPQMGYSAMSRPGREHCNARKAGASSSGCAKYSGCCGQTDSTSRRSVLSPMSRMPVGRVPAPKI